MKINCKLLLIIAAVFLLIGTRPDPVRAAADDPWNGYWRWDYFALAPEDAYRGTLFLNHDLNSRWEFETFFSGFSDVEPPDDSIWSFAMKDTKTNRSFRYFRDLVLVEDPAEHDLIYQQYQDVLEYGWESKPREHQWQWETYFALGKHQNDRTVGGFEFKGRKDTGKQSLTLGVEYEDFLHSWEEHLAFKLYWYAYQANFYYGTDLVFNGLQEEGFPNLYGNFCEYSFYIVNYYWERRLRLKLRYGGTEDFEYAESSYQYHELGWRYRFSKTFSFEGLYRVYLADSYAPNYTNTLIYKVTPHNQAELSFTNLAVSDYELFDSKYGYYPDTIRFSWQYDF